MTERKNLIRTRMMALRRNTPRNKVEKWSRRIMDRLFELQEYRDARSVMFYVSYDNEVRTHEMIRRALSSKKVSVPLLDEGKIVPIQIKGWEELKRGAYGILEPTHKNVASDIELVLVPGVAFDESGHRIGHGLGYYDEFMRKFGGIKIGLAFEFQIVSELPYEENDVRVDKIITERRVIEGRG